MRIPAWERENFRLNKGNIFPSSKSLVSDIPPWEGKTAKPFFTVYRCIANRNIGSLISRSFAQLVFPVQSAESSGVLARGIHMHGESTGARCTPCQAEPFPMAIHVSRSLSHSYLQITLAINHYKSYSSIPRVQVLG